MQTFKRLIVTDSKVFVTGF